MNTIVISVKRLSIGPCTPKLTRTQSIGWCWRGQSRHSRLGWLQRSHGLFTLLNDGLGFGHNVLDLMKRDSLLRMNIYMTKFTNKKVNEWMLFRTCWAWICPGLICELPFASLIFVPPLSFSFSMSLSFLSSFFLSDFSSVFTLALLASLSLSFSSSLCDRLRPPLSVLTFPATSSNAAKDWQRKFFHDNAIILD